MLTFWQLYSSHTLSTDIAYWEKRKSDNRRPLAELNQASRNLDIKSTRLDYAYDLMGAPYPVSDFIFSLGRSRPADLRIDTIDSTDTRAGDTRRVARTLRAGQPYLRRYVEDLRRDPAIGPLFASIALTSIDRSDTASGPGSPGGTDSLNFEITFKLKTAKP